MTELPHYLAAHLQLTLLALAVAAAVSLPLGILISRSPRWEQPVLGVASVIQTVPALALLAAMVPLLALLHVPSIGFLPAFLALSLYGVLPILRNTVVGISGVDAIYKEAARGVGMTPAQQLRLVELPLATPVIIAGIRTATVWLVGMATLSTPVGAPSLGHYIFSGLQTRNHEALLIGCIAAAALALSLDGTIRVLERGLRTRSRVTTAIGVGLLGLFVLVAAADLLRPQTKEATVTIGAKTFTEQFILAEILAGQVERKADTHAEVLRSLGSTVAFDALRNGELDVYVDYSGTLWATVLKREGLPEERGKVMEEVTRELREKDGIVVVGALGFENAYALAMREKDAARLGVASISDLAAHARGLSIGGDYEFFSRPEWASIQRRYGLGFNAQRSMDPSLMYQAAGQGEVDVISAFSTDGRIAAYNLRVLRDDRGAIPPYDAVILAGPSLVREHPRVLDALRALTGTISEERMRAMNLAVDADGADPAVVARDFLGTLP